MVEPLLGNDVAQAVLRHHERVDGRGYPSRLTGNAIPLPSRVIQICDAYIAMSSRRSYQAPYPAEDARHVVRRLGNWRVGRPGDRCAELLAGRAEIHRDAGSPHHVPCLFREPRHDLVQFLGGLHRDSVAGRGCVRMAFECALNRCLNDVGRRGTAQHPHVEA